jgi:hypothetical protein
MNFHYKEEHHLTRNDCLVNMWRSPVKDRNNSLIGMINMGNLRGVPISAMWNVFVTHGDVVYGSNLQQLLSKLKVIVNEIEATIHRKIVIEYVKH